MWKASPLHIYCYRMDAVAWAVLAVAWLVSFGLILKAINLTTHKKNSPPGPRQWPIIGNLNIIGPILHQTLHELAKKYGELMQLKFGSRPVVVVSSPAMAKQILKIHDENFATRPATAAGKYIGYNHSDVTWATYGPYWRQARKIYATQIFSPKRLDSNECIRVQEMRAFISLLHSLSGTPIELRKYLARFTLTYMSKVVLSDKYFGKSTGESCIVTYEDFQEMLDEWFLLNGVLNIGDWISWLNFLDLQGYVKRMKASSEKFDRFFTYVIDDHIAKRKEKKNFEANDFVDVLLQLADDPNLEIKLNHERVKALIHDLIAGGTDTAAVTLEWAFTELLKQPRILDKAIIELDRVIGKDRWVEEKDFPQLPYLDAIVKETLRVHPAATFLGPHMAINDCKISDYYVRKGTVVLVNLWSMGRNPNYWDSPEHFLPERFLGKEIDANGHHFEFIPFGSGRRMCPGYRLGLKLVKSTLANLLHGFTWKLPENMKPEDIGMEEVYGLTTHKKIPMVAFVEPKLASHMYSWLT